MSAGLSDGPLHRLTIGARRLSLGGALAATVDSAVFFAGLGYRVTAFDAASEGVEKTLRLAEESAVSVDVMTGDINHYRLADDFDILFATGVLQYIPPKEREGLLAHYRRHTPTGGLNVFSVLVEKPFIQRAPDTESTAFPWFSGEILTHYRNWRVEHFTEEIFHCRSGGVPHRHAVNRIVARKMLS